MRRRDFITLLSGTAAAWPLVARAQQPAMPVVGFLHPGTPEATAYVVTPFRQGLSETGYVEDRNVKIEYRWAHDDNDRLPELAADLVRRGVAVIATPNSTPATLAAKAATTTIPVVFQIAGDPVQMGLVASRNRPGGNVTGVSSMNVELGAKRLGLLHELLPAAERFAVLVNPSNLGSDVSTVLQGMASSIGAQIEVLSAATNRDIDTAFATLVNKRADALLTSPDVFFIIRRVQIVTLAARHAVPAVYHVRDFTEVGGLMSYSTKLADQYRQAGIYTGRILRGEKPADLPIMQPTKFEFVINLQTARTLGLTIPPTLLAIADEVIE
jgi:putative ABC transport system substrate-binding protein